MPPRIRPKLLDLFCGAGGCAVGYHRTGFDVVGVDIKPQPNYPFEFHKGDAIAFCLDHYDGFDAIHASPPCKTHTKLKGFSAKHHIDFVPQTKQLLRSLGLPYVIENVVGCPLKNPILLCGSMFGLRVRRHRLFQSNIKLSQPTCQHGTEPVVQVNGQPGGSSRRDPHLPRHSLEEWKQAMGIDWMTSKEISQAIPPAYTEFIGRQLIEYLRGVG